MYLGDFTTANTVYVYFNTFDSNDPSASVTLTGLATSDILIYKNGSTTERSSTAGFTLLDTDGIDFDGKTGIHGFSIDLSDNTDSGFYAAGGEYTVVVASVTVDAATVNFVAAQFSIERTGGVLALLKGTNSLANIEDKIDTLTTNVATIDDFLDTEIAAILADTNELQTDWANGGRLDLILDARASQASVDTIDGIVDAILLDTAEIGAAGAGLTALASAANLATVDTVADAIKVKTDQLTFTVANQVDSNALSGGGGLDAAGVRAAVGLASANLDTQLGDLPTATENADALLNRDMSAVSDTNDRTPLNALRFLRNKWSTSGGTLTVTKEDDSTVAFTSVLTSDAAADPVTGSDPA